MTFTDTTDGQAFIASGDSRETSPHIMRAIAFFARSLDEAERLWSGDGFGKIAHLSDIWEHATNNGVRDARSLHWGDGTLADVMAFADANND